jgi:hypothetical protein
VQCSAVKSPGEFLVEFRGSTVIEREMAGRLHSDLKCWALCWDPLPGYD